MRIVLATALLALLSICPSGSVPVIRKELVTKWHGPLIEARPTVVDPSEPEEEEEGGCCPDCECIPIEANTPHHVTLQIIRHLAHIHSDPYENILPHDREMSIEDFETRPTGETRGTTAIFTARVPAAVIKKCTKSFRDSQVPRFMISPLIESDSKGNRIVKRVTQKDIIRLPWSPPDKRPSFEIIPDFEDGDEYEGPNVKPVPVGVRRPKPPIVKPPRCVLPPRKPILQKPDISPAYAIPNEGSKGEFIIIEDDEDDEYDEIDIPEVAEHSESEKPWSFEILDDVTEEDENPLEDLILNGARSSKGTIPIDRSAGLVKIGQTKT